MNMYDASAHEELNQEWELQILSEAWTEELKKYEFTINEDNINKLYSKAIELQLQNRYGFVMPSHMFYEDVEGGFFTNYDGHGYFLDWEGHEQGYVSCDVSWLEDKIEQYPFVAWFNK